MFDDIVNELAPLFEAADGLVIASPVYYASANATLIACLDRLFYSTSFDKSMKVGASVVCARRGGCSATFDELNKFFTISNMPIASSRYWNSIHGCEKGEAEMDEEGKQTMRMLAKEYDISYEVHRAWQERIWSSGTGGADGDEFYSVSLRESEHF